ncbi:MAG: hypothetical protein Q8P42_00930 [Gallionella sp.]|nr:hypothetical protein [Gallionella sp.]
MKFEQKALVKAGDGALQEQERAATELRIATPGGRLHVRWDEGGKRHGAGAVAVLCRISESLGAVRPLVGRMSDGLHQPQPPDIVDVLGICAVDSGWAAALCPRSRAARRRCRPPQILGMNKIVSDESLRRALAHLAPDQPKHCSEEERAARAAQMEKSTA